MFSVYWKEFAQCMKWSKRFLAIPYCWNATKNEVTIIDSRNYQRAFKAFSWLSYIHSACLFVFNCLVLGAMMNVPQFHKMISTGFTVASFITVVCRRMYSSRVLAEDIASLLSAMLQYEKFHRTPSKITKCPKLAICHPCFV
jgi:hypothetical protein